MKVVYYCSIVVELRGSEDCNGVLHQIATSRQMAKEHHDHDIDVEGSVRERLKLDKRSVD